MENNNQTTPIENLNNYLSKKSTMEILGVDRDENAHSNFLAWLFENEETGKVACQLLIKLLDDKEKEKVPDAIRKLAEEKEEKEIKISKINVIREDFVECGDYHGRADIVINITTNNNEKLHIIIENKIDSLEHRMGKDNKKEDADGADWQTIGYYKYYKKKYYDEPIAFVFLTRPKYQITLPKNNSDSRTKDCECEFANCPHTHSVKLKYEKEPKCKEYIPIDYQDLLERVLSKLSQEQIIDYNRCLGINKTQDNIIAVSEELKGKAEKAWEYILNQKGNGIESYQDILRPVVEVLNCVSGKNSTKDNKIDDIYKIINGKDYTTYDIEIKDSNEPNCTNLTKNGLVKKVIELYIRKEKDQNLEINCKRLKDVFKPSLRMISKGSTASSNSLSNQVVINLEEYLKKKNEYLKDSIKEIDEAHNKIQKDDDWKELEGVEDCYVIQTGWDGRPMMNYFIEYAERIMPSIKIKECVKKTKLKKIINIICK